jgi:hypothetical protein
MVMAMLAACGAGSVETYRAAEVELSMPGPANPNGEAVAGLYTFGAAGEEGGRDPFPASFKIFILDSGRVYAIAWDSAGVVKNIYIGNGAQEKVPVVADPLANGPSAAERYSFDSTGIRDFRVPLTGRPAPIQTVSLTSLVRPGDIIYNGILKRDGANVAFRAAYDRAFNSLLPAIAKIATGSTYRYAGLFALGDIAATGDRGSLGVRVEDVGDGTAKLIIENGCAGTSGTLKPSAKGNFYDVSFSYQAGACGGEPFTGHAIVENDKAGAQHITIMAANAKFTQVLGFVGVIETSPTP